MQQLRTFKKLGCLNCDKDEDEKPMVYRGEPWCSENCKEAIHQKELPY